MFRPGLIATAQRPLGQPDTFPVVKRTVPPYVFLQHGPGLRFRSG